MESITISFVTTDEQLKRVDGVAAAENRTRSNTLGLLIDLGIDALETRRSPARVALAHAAAAALCSAREEGEVGA